MVRKAPGATPAIVALTRANIEFTLREYEHVAGVTEFGAEASAALGVPAEQILKTLLTVVDGQPTVAVVPVAGKLNLKNLAAARHGRRAQMMDAAAVHARTGYVLGGVSPFGQRKSFPTVIDESAKQFRTVLVSAGKRGLDIELAPKDLAAATQGIWADIARL